MRRMHREQEQHESRQCEVAFERFVDALYYGSSIASSRRPAIIWENYSFGFRDNEMEGS